MTITVKTMNEEKVKVEILVQEEEDMPEVKVQTVPPVHKNRNRLTAKRR